jgi:hypothetical protein
MLDLINIGKKAINKYLPDKAKAIAGAALGQFSPVTQPQLSYMWELRFLDPFGSSNGDKVSYYAKATAFPPIQTELIKRRFCGVEYSIPSKDISPKIFRVTFYDNQNMDVYKFFRRWKELTGYGDENKVVKNTINGVYSYRRDIELYMKDTTDILKNSYLYIKDAYPTEISEVSLSYAENGEISFDVMFSYFKTDFRS